MGMNIVTKEQMKHSLDNWYRVMLQQNIEKATEMKEEIDSTISGLDVDQDVLLYHTLLNFRYDALVDWISIREDSFDKVESFEIPEEGFLAYYYHFFKGFHCTLISNYNEAKQQYEQAEKLLKYIADPIEHAEFNYRMGNFYYQKYDQVHAIDYLNRAKAAFLKYPGYEIKIGLCENAFGLCCVDIDHYELAEENFNAAMEVLQKANQKKYMLMVRHNLAWLYASQNLSELAIRHISEVTKNYPEHFKALFVEAREHYKIGEYNLANPIVEKGLNICIDLGEKEFQHRFKILKELNGNSSISIIEDVILKGLSYFERERLWDCIQEYTEILAMKFYEVDDHVKASKYFYMNNKAQKNILEKGALN